MDFEEFSLANSRTLSPSARVHRVFHRIGIVGGGVFLAAAIAVADLALWSVTFGGPQHYSKLSDVPKYDLPDIDGAPWFKFSGDVDSALVLSDDTRVMTKETFLREYNDRKVDAFWAYVRNNFWIASALLGISIALYAAFRTLGWIVAGAFKS